MLRIATFRHDLRPADLFGNLRLRRGGLIQFLNGFLGCLCSLFGLFGQCFQSLCFGLGLVGSFELLFDLDSQAFAFEAFVLNLVIVIDGFLFQTLGAFNRFLRRAVSAVLPSRAASSRATFTSSALTGFAASASTDGGFETGSDS
jgi:hypothetical protein